jgi:uncharacterized protein YdiU (UPF0061 family)
MPEQNVKTEHRYLELPDYFYSRVKPAPLKSGQVVCFNAPLAETMGFKSTNPQDWAGVGSGNELLEGMDPVAMKYTGHQFGVYNPELGDGRSGHPHYPRIVYGQCPRPGETGVH